MEWICLLNVMVCVIYMEFVMKTSFCGKFVIWGSNYILPKILYCNIMSLLCCNPTIFVLQDWLILYVVTSYYFHILEMLISKWYFKAVNIASGSPFTFLVIDPTKVSARGDGLGFVPVRKQTSFSVYAPYATSQDLEVSVIGKYESFVSLN